MLHPVIRSAAALALAGALSGAATAEDIAGRWTFKTDSLPSNGCVITGEMSITKTARKTEFTCMFSSREDCTQPDGSRSFQSVKQACSAILQDDSYIITSSVVAMIDAGPPERRAELMSPGRYKADNFRVKPTAKDVMTGVFSSIQQAGVKFWRVADLVS